MLSENLRVYRQQNNLTMVELSEKTSISQGYISRIESGQFDDLTLSVKVASQLAKEFGISIEQLTNNSHE